MEVRFLFSFSLGGLAGIGVFFVPLAPFLPRGVALGLGGGVGDLGGGEGDFSSSSSSSSTSSGSSSASESSDSGSGSGSGALAAAGTGSSSCSGSDSGSESPVVSVWLTAVKPLAGAVAAVAVAAVERIPALECGSLEALYSASSLS